MKKRGQLLSQPFFYISAIIVIGLILIFGFKVIGDLRRTGCNVENAKFLNELEKNIDDMYTNFPGSSEDCSIVNSYGSSKNTCEIQAPSGIAGMCFVDFGNTVNTESIPFTNLKEDLQIIQKGGGDDYNIYFAPKQENCKIDRKRITKIKIKENFCIDFNKKNKIRLENVGRSVEIRKV